MWIPALGSATAAAPFYLSGAGMQFVPFLLTLIAGALGGVWLVGLTFVMRPPGAGLAVHAGLAVVLTTAMIALNAGDGWGVIGALPTPVGPLAILSAMAAIPMTGWVAMSLLGRLVEAIPSRRSATAEEVPKPVAPAWERSRGQWAVTIDALPLRMRTLVLVILVIVLVCGGATLALLIRFEAAVYILGTRVSLLLVAALTALPVLALLHAAARRRTRSHRIRFTVDALLIDEARMGFAEVSDLRWQPAGEYARLTVRTRDGVDRSLFLGFAGARATAGLPALPAEIERGLAEAGLTRTQNKRGLVRWRRASMGG